MGDAEQADLSKLPPQDWMESAEWERSQGHLSLQASYVRLHENLLDLTHETFVHARTIGNAAVAETPMSSEVIGNEVHVRRIMQATPAPPLFKKVRGLHTIDRWQLIRFQPPSSISIDARGYPAGSDDISQGLRWFSLNAITPIDARSCRYY
jgi:vanillate O-demethylase monooxygenase subunit